jgi:putative effector of murein hydrolase LrgA (UPF0299 family)
MVGGTCDGWVCDLDVVMVGAGWVCDLDVVDVPSIFGLLILFQDFSSHNVTVTNVTSTAQRFLHNLKRRSESS